jgi:hypothetical protein
VREAAGIERSKGTHPSGRVPAPNLAGRRLPNPNLGRLFENQSLDDSSWSHTEIHRKVTNVGLSLYSGIL